MSVAHPVLLVIQDVGGMLTPFQDPILTLSQTPTLSLTPDPILATVYTTADSYIPDGNGGGHIGGGQIGGGLGLGSIIGGGSQWSHHKQWSSSWQSGSHRSIGGRIIGRGHEGIIGGGQGGIIGGGQGEIIGGGHVGIIGTGQGGIIGEGQGGIIKQKGCGPYGCGHYRRK
nr:glycine-rich cell wall structural protein [Crassostrea gigas]